MTKVRAHAKLTLSLRVLGTRPDGFHELDALVVSLGQPFDTVTVSRAADPGVMGLVVTGDEVVSSGSDNLVVRAVEALMAHAGVTDGVHVELAKRIPVRAGLGGGSADAAAALVATRAELGLDVSDATLAAIGGELGSDVAFCLAGQGAAWMRGRGEVIEPVALPLGIPVLVAAPTFGCSTAAVYAAWDEMGAPSSARRVPAPATVAPVLGELANDLEPAAERVEPALVELRERFEAATGRPSLLAGSGSALVVVLDDARRLHEVAAEASSRLGFDVIPSATVSRGVKPV